MADDEEKREYNTLLRANGGARLRPRTQSANSVRESRAWMVSKKCVSESMDFEELESVMWRKHQLRRFFQDRGNWWTSSRRTTAWKWVLVIVTGVLIACMGALVQEVINRLITFKFDIAMGYLEDNSWSKSFFSYYFISIFYALIAGLLCVIDPAAAGSGIPEIKAYLNGVNLNKVVRIKVLFTKAIGMCFSVASGLPLGKEGPMIHTGSIVGAAVSQGKTITFGFDTSWSKFQDLRNDRSKRDFVTFGAAAGVAAAFRAPIGGILFTLEEGASFWSTSLTFRSFFCAMMTMLTISLIYDGFTFQNTATVGFQFGTFNDADYRTYELVVFLIMGVAGGVLGAFFNYINEHVTKFRMKHYDSKWKKVLELFVITSVFTVISFVLPLMWQKCTLVPTETANWNSQQYELLPELVQFQCPENQYNEVASLYFTSADTTMQQLLHYQEANGSNYSTFSTGALLLFFIPYFIMAAVTSGTFCPAGLFVPTLLAGAAYGRIVGHILNRAFPGHVASSGTYALIGAAALLGGMARMTIAGAVIVQEACGSNSFLLPLMLTFAASRYAGNAINQAMYDMQIHLKEMPFLEGSLKTLGLLNYHPVAEVMAHPVVDILEVMRVGEIYEILKATTHNGFPVVTKEGHLRGLMLRKVLCSLLKHKIFSLPVESSGSKLGENRIQLAPAAALFHDTIERNYPHYPSIEDIQLAPHEMNAWLDVRPYMDTAPYSINESSSVQRCYRFFRTMGLRHLVVLDGDHCVTGIITRQDLTEHRLEHHWFQEGDNMQKFISVDPMDPAVVTNSPSDRDGGGGSVSGSRTSSVDLGEGIQLRPPVFGGGGVSQSPLWQGPSSPSKKAGGGVNDAPTYQQQQQPTKVGGYVAPIPPPPPVPPLLPSESTAVGSIPPPPPSRQPGSSRSREPKAQKEPKSLRPNF